MNHRGNNVFTLTHRFRVEMFLCVVAVNVVCTCNHRCHFTSDLTTEIPLNVDCGKCDQVLAFREVEFTHGLWTRRRQKKKHTEMSMEQRSTDRLCLLSNRVEVITCVKQNPFVANIICLTDSILHSLRIRCIAWEMRTMNTAMTLTVATTMQFRFADFPHTSSSNNFNGKQ